MTDPAHDDYLFDPAATPDPEVARLESLLRPYRYGGGAGPAAEASQPSTQGTATAAGSGDAAATAAQSLPSNQSRRPLFLFYAAALCLTLILGALAARELLDRFMTQGRTTRSTDTDRTDDTNLKTDTDRNGDRPGDVTGQDLAGLPIQVLAGSPALNGVTFVPGDRLLPGARLTTDAVSRARIELSHGARNYGRIDVEPGTDLSLIIANSGEQRLSLARGEIRALTWAPPRLLFIETPSAVAVDLGCAYTLKVDADGRGLLSVTSGYVAFERDGRESLVPRGASCATEIGRGPGTPYFDDAPDALKDALHRFDFSDDKRAALPEILQAATRSKDTLTLWHLLPRLAGDDRLSATGLTLKLVPPPSDVDFARAAALDPAVTGAWKAWLRVHW